MAFDFPATPINGQVFTPPGGGPSYIWNGSVWMMSSPPSFLWWPAGVGFNFWGSVEPAGTRLCYGQALSRTTFAALFAAIQTTFGAGDGSTTFNLPDARGRTEAGRDDMGGTDAGRLSNLTGTVLGSAGGTQIEVLTVGHLPSHTHTQQGTFGSGGMSSGHYHGFTYYALYGGAPNQFAGGTGYHGNPTGGNTGGQDVDHSHNTTIYGETAAVGSGSAHNNIQPTIVCNKLITTGGVV